jgi:hypothetical protein
LKPFFIKIYLCDLKSEEEEDLEKMDQMASHSNKNSSTIKNEDQPQFEEKRIIWNDVNVRNIKYPNSNFSHVDLNEE